jgi:hypothetical protein
MLVWRRQRLSERAPRRRWAFEVPTIVAAWAIPSLPWGVGRPCVGRPCVARSGVATSPIHPSRRVRARRASPECQPPRLQTPTRGEGTRHGRRPGRRPLRPARPRASTNLPGPAGGRRHSQATRQMSGSSTAAAALRISQEVANNTRQRPRPNATTSIRGKDSRRGRIGLCGRGRTRHSLQRWMSPSVSCLLWSMTGASA